MNKKVCKHPRKMVNLMRDFILAATDLTFDTATFDTATFDDDNFCYDIVSVKCNCKVKRTGRFEAFIGEFEEDDSLIIIGYNFKKLPYVRDYFTKDFHNRCKISKGFAGVTLALLHELGHFETTYACDIIHPDWDRGTAYELLEKKYKSTNNLAEANKEYFTWPDEKMATEWAMDWLQKPENRKLAKKFEKLFFACFAEE